MLHADSDQSLTFIEFGFYARNSTTEKKERKKKDFVLEPKKPKGKKKSLCYT